jgi:hypothetical protein
MADPKKSFQQLLITNFGLSPSGYTGSIGATGPAGPAGGYTGSAGGTGYVGSAGTGVTLTADTFTGDGVTTAFTLGTTPGNINQTMVNYNGVTVLRSTYSLSGNAITFSSAPEVGSAIEVTTINSAAGSGSAATGTALKITTIGYVGNNTATDVAGGETITLTGTGFVAGASVIINGVAAGVVTVASATQLTFTAPAMAAGTYIFYVVNTDGATAISVPGISYSGVPSFYAGAGSVGTVYEASSFNSNVSAVGDATITYTIASGSLPSGATLNANGVITGSSVLTASPTTYTFGVNASDGQNQDVTRTYTITVNPDVVTWSSPASGTTVSLGQGSSSTTTLSAVSAAGKAITYTANTLPTGLSISGNVVTGTPTTLGNTTTLLTANATSTTRSATITVTWNITVTNEPYFMYNSLLLSGNGTNNSQNNTFVDSSTNNFAITRAGNTTQGTFSPYGPNWSNAFTASSGDYLSVPYSSAFNLTGDFTVECWFNPSLLPTSAGVGTPLYPRIFSFGTYNAANSLGLEINSDGSVSKAIGVWYNGSPNFSANNIVTVGQWYHCAIVRSGTTITVYLNGTSVITISSASAAVNTSQAFFIGSLQGYTTSAEACFKGSISNLRIVKGTAVYTSAFTPSTSPLTAIANTTLLTCQSNRFIDNSSTAAPISSFGTAGIQRFSPFGPGAAYSASTTGGSAYFDGSGDSLGSPQSATFNLSAGNWTIEGWYYSFDNLSSSARYMTFTPSSGNVIGLIPASSGDCFGINVFGGSNVLTTTVAPTLRAWQHVALVKNGSTTTIYVNGVSAGSATISWVNANTTVFFGGNTGSFAYSFSGYITDSRVVMGTAVYTGNFTPPTSPLTAITNTALLLNYTNAGITDSAMINNIETVGDAKISTTQSKFGGSSMYFDGTGDYLFSTSSPNFGITNIFTVECWLYLTVLPSGSNAMYITDFRGGTTNNYAFGVINSGANTILYGYLGSIGGEIRGSTNITTGAWYHMAFVNTGSTLTGYLNGVSQGTLTTSFNQAATNLIVGARYTGATEYINGYIDDLRITRGYARYTANFTPPASAFSQK